MSALRGTKLPNFKEEEGERDADVAGTYAPPPERGGEAHGRTRARGPPSKSEPQAAAIRITKVSVARPAKSVHTTRPGPSARGTSHCAAINHAALWE